MNALRQIYKLVVVRSIAQQATCVEQSVRIMLEAIPAHVVKDTICSMIHCAQVGTERDLYYSFGLLKN